jgi:hypothetical protein
MRNPAPREQSVFKKSQVLILGLVFASAISISDEPVPPPRPATFPNGLNVGPVALNGTSYASAETVTADALGSGVNGPLTAQTGLTINMTKDNWWTGGKVGEVDGLNVLLRQNAPDSDSSGILVNVQNQGNGFLSATEFASSIVDPVSNTLTFGIDVQEGALNKPTGGYYGAVYTADYGALSTGVLIQNSIPSASWQYAIQYQKNGSVLFSVDGSGHIVGSGAYFGGVGLNGDKINGSIDVGNLSNESATPYITFNGFGRASEVRLINDAHGRLTIATATGGVLQLDESGVRTSGGFQINLSTPSSSSAPCSPGQFGADRDFIYVCVAANTWRRSPLSSF